MLDACATGQNGQVRLTLLSTWLGHVHPGSTYCYLSASPELMAIAGQRLEVYLPNEQMPSCLGDDLAEGSRVARWKGTC